MRVLVADDPVWLRSALRLLLEQEPEIEILGEAGDADALLDLAAAHNPDLLLVDWELPGFTSSKHAKQALAHLRVDHPGLYIIVLSGRPESGRPALAAGANAFVSKADPPETLLAALRKAKRSFNIYEA